MSNESSRTDRDLVRAMVNGDREAFTELMSRHEDKVFSITHRITNDRSDALDATQETFVTVYTRASSFRGESAFSTWLYRIAVNAAHDVLRKRGRATPSEDPAATLPDLTGTSPDSAAGRVDIVRALATLPSEYREAVVMHDVGGIPYEEIAAEAGVALGTVKSRISRGRRLLARALEPERFRDTSKERP